MIILKYIWEFHWLICSKQYHNSSFPTSLCGETNDGILFLQIFKKPLCFSSSDKLWKMKICFTLSFFIWRFLQNVKNLTIINFVRNICPKNPNICPKFKRPKLLFDTYVIAVVCDNNWRIATTITRTTIANYFKFKMWLDPL